jgi:hypothetical protein
MPSALPQATCAQANLAKEKRPMADEKKNVYLTLHKRFVKENIEYTDRHTGELRSFNSVTLPKDTLIDGQDMSYYQFSPLFVNPSRFKGEDFRDIPLLANREVQLTKTVMDTEGNPVLDSQGNQQKETAFVMPAQIKQALDDARSRYLQEQQKERNFGRDTRPLSERAEQARAGASALSSEDIPFDVYER